MSWVRAIPRESGHILFSSSHWSPWEGVNGQVEPYCWHGALPLFKRFERFRVAAQGRPAMPIVNKSTVNCTFIRKHCRKVVLDIVVKARINLLVG